MKHRRVRTLQAIGITMFLVACSTQLFTAVPRLSPAEKAAAKRRTQAVTVGPQDSVVLAIAGNVGGDPSDAWLFNSGNGRPGYGRQKATAELVSAINPHAVLLTGNAQYSDGAYDKYLVSYDPSWGLFKGITFPAIGGHDYDTDGYSRYFGSVVGDPAKAYYSFDLGAWHIVALNTVTEKVGVEYGSEQERWLRADLEASKGKHVLAYMQGALYSSGSYGSNQAYRALYQALYDYGAKLVVSGLDHVYERFAPQDAFGRADERGPRQFTSGLGGSTLYKFGTVRPNSEARYNASFGVLKLVLQPDAYEWKFIPEAGSTFTDEGRMGLGTVATPSPSPTLAPTTEPSPTPVPTIEPSVTPSPVAPSPVATLVPLPSIPPDQPVVVAAAGDIAGDPDDVWLFNGGLGRPDACRQWYTSEIVRNINPDVVLTLGDNQYYDGAEPKYARSYDPSWGRFKAITRPAVGDHDFDSPNPGYFKYFGAAAGDPTKGYYSFDLGAWHFVCLNSNTQLVRVDEDSEQLQWLKADLEANKGKHILAYWHNGLYSSGTHGSNDVYEPFWVVLYQYDAKIVLNGNDHVYERFAPQDPWGVARPDGIRQFTAGLGGMLLYPFQTIRPNSQARYNASFGVLKLTLHPTSYEWEFIAEGRRPPVDKGRQLLN